MSDLLFDNPTNTLSQHHSNVVFTTLCVYRVLKQRCISACVSNYIGQRLCCSGAPVDLSLYCSLMVGDLFVWYGSRMISQGFDLIKIPYLLDVFGNLGISKQCRLRSDVYTVCHSPGV